MVVLPASGCEMMAKVRRLATSEVNWLIGVGASRKFRGAIITGTAPSCRERSSRHRQGSGRARPAVAVGASAAASDRRARTTTAFAATAAAPPTVIAAAIATRVAAVVPIAARARRPAPTLSGRPVVGLGAATSRGVLTDLKAGYDLTWNGALDQSLDVAQLPRFVGTDQRQRFAIGTGPAGTADAVHVILRNMGQIEVDHLRQLNDIDAARGDVGCHQNLHLAVLEFGQGLGALRLALVAVDGGGVNAVAIEQFHQLVGTVLGAAEHQRLVPVVLADQVAQQRSLALLVHRHDRLLDGFGGGVARRHIDLDRIAQQALGEAANVVGEGR